MRDYKKTEIWKMAHEHYMFMKKSLTIPFSGEKGFERTVQLLKSSLYVPLNILEGCGRFADKDFARFQGMALGAINEADYCCFTAFESNNSTDEEYHMVNKLINETRAMRISLIKFLRNGVCQFKP